jgi:hypothetical protein
VLSIPAVARRTGKVGLSRVDRGTAHWMINHQCRFKDTYVCLNTLMHACSERFV